jgi:thioredoxin 1
LEGRSPFELPSIALLNTELKPQRAFLKIGNLGDELMINEPVHVTDAVFETTVLKSDLPVIVDFWAPWCGPCRMVAPTLEKLAKELSGKILIAKVNTDENPDWAQRYGVQGIPTMLLVSGGKIVHRQVGALPEKMLREVVGQFLEVVAQPPVA